jgi:hypothetical protein
MFAKKLIVLSFLVATSVSVCVAGCSKTAEKKPSASSAVASGEANSHEGWWCNEHGVPEEVCAQCSAKLAADFKAKGDWCAKNDRPESQCFICHPEKETEFAALYEAKFGKKPPKIEQSSGDEKPKS